MGCGKPSKPAGKPVQSSKPVSEPIRTVSTSMVNKPTASDERSLTASTCCATPKQPVAQAIQPQGGDTKSEAAATQAPHAIASPQSPMTKRECTEQVEAKSDPSAALSESDVIDVQAFNREATMLESSGLIVERVGARVVVAGETLDCYMLSQCALSVVNKSSCA